MKTKLFVSNLLVLCILYSCSFAQSVEERNLDAFNALSISSSFEVFIKKGGKESAKIEAKGIELDKIITEVKDNKLTLKLRNDSRDWNWSNYKITVYVTYQTLEKISISGSSKVTAESPINAKKLDIGISGSGNLQAKVEVEALDIDISGSGKLNLSGKTTSQDIRISGSGKIMAFDLSSDSAEVAISGSGDADISVNKSLLSRISGSGSVRYIGNPEKLESRSSGSGNIKKVSNKN